MEPTKKESKFKSPSVNKGQPPPKLSSETLGINAAKIPQASSNTAWINPNNPYFKRKNEIDEKKIKLEEKQGISKDEVASYYSQAQSQDIGTTAAFNSIINNLKITIGGQNGSEESDLEVSFINIVPPSPSTQQE
jgi:hypothetical protein